MALNYIISIFYVRCYEFETKMGEIFVAKVKIKDFEWLDLHYLFHKKKNLL